MCKTTCGAVFVWNASCKPALVGHNPIEDQLDPPAVEHGGQLLGARHRKAASRRSMFVERLPTTPVPFFIHGLRNVSHASAAIEQPACQSHACHLGKRCGLLGIYNLLHQPQVGATVAYAYLIATRTDLETALFARTYALATRAPCCSAYRIDRLLFSPLISR